MRIKSKGDIDQLAQKGLKRLNPKEVRIQVGTATCGLSKGARETVEALKKAVGEADLKAEIVCVGCNGLCYAEPIVEVIRPHMPKITYGEITKEKVASLVRAVKAGEIDTENRVICQASVEKSVTGSSIVYGRRIEGIPEAAHVGGRKGQIKIVMRNTGVIDPLSLEEYAATGGFSGLVKALSGKPPNGRL